MQHSTLFLIILPFLNSFQKGELVEETFESLLGNIDLDPEVGAVVVDLDINLTYTDLNIAVNHLLKPDCHLYAGATDQAVAFQGGKVVIGTFPKSIRTISQS